MSRRATPSSTADGRDGMTGTITAVVVLAADAPAGAALHVLLEDVSQADRAARVAARFDQRVRALPAGARITLSLDAPALDAAAHYALRAHLDIDGDGRLTPGD